MVNTDRESTPYKERDGYMYVFDWREYNWLSYAIEKLKPSSQLKKGHVGTFGLLNVSQRMVCFMLIGGAPDIIINKDKVTPGDID